MIYNYSYSTTSGSWQTTFTFCIRNEEIFIATFILPHVFCSVIHVAPGFIFVEYFVASWAKLENSR